MVTREEIQRGLWPAETFVDFEHSLNAAIKRLRAALGDSARAPRFIETLAGRGYRFIAPVREPAPEIQENVPASPVPVRQRRFLLAAAAVLIFVTALGVLFARKSGRPGRNPAPATRIASLAACPWRTSPAITARIILSTA